MGPHDALHRRKLPGRIAIPDVWSSYAQPELPRAAFSDSLFLEGFYFGSAQIVRLCHSLTLGSALVARMGYVVGVVIQGYEAGASTG